MSSTTCWPGWGSAEARPDADGPIGRRLTPGRTFPYTDRPEEDRAWAEFQANPRAERGSMMLGRRRGFEPGPRGGLYESNQTHDLRDTVHAPHRHRLDRVRLCHGL